jgi:hypothetical protein
MFRSASIPAALAVFALVSLAPHAKAQNSNTAAAAPATSMASYNCNGLNKTKIKVSKVFAGSQFFPNSLAFVDVPDGKLRITVGGNSNSCVLVTVSAMGAISGADTEENIRVVMTPGHPAYPPEVTMWQNTPPGHVESRTHQFVFPSVPPGKKIIKLQVRSTEANVSPASGFIHDPVIRIDYK